VSAALCEGKAKFGEHAGCDSVRLELLEKTQLAFPFAESLSSALSGKPVVAAEN